jgi:hypothetical protein
MKFFPCDNAGRIFITVPISFPTTDTSNLYPSFFLLIRLFHILESLSLNETSFPLSEDYPSNDFYALLKNISGLYEPFPRHTTISSIKL